MTETTRQLERFHRQLLLVTPASWKAATSLGALAVRSSQLKAVDDELEEYHKAAALKPGYNTLLDLKVISLYYALDHWKKTDLKDRDPAHLNDWKKNRRNRNGVITKLYDLLFEYTMLVIGTSTAALPRSDREAFQMIENAAKNSFVDLFRGARMVAKGSYKRELAGEIAGGALTLFGVTDRVMNSGQVAAASEFVNKIVEAVKNYYNTGGGVVSVIRTVVDALGVANDFFQSCLETVARAIGKFLSSIPGISFIVDAYNVASSFYAALGAHMQVLAGDRARYLVRPGAVDDAYNSIVQFWRDDRASKLKEGAVSLAKALIKGVAAACSLGLSAAAETAVNIADKVYSACKKVWDFITDVIKMVGEYTGINEALAKLGTGDYSASKMFEISPLLACYYFISIPTNNLLRFQASMIAMKGSMDVIGAAAARMEPVIEAAAEFIGESKFMFVTRTKKMFPVKCDLKNPSLLEEIKAAIKEGAEGLVEGLVPEMPEIVIAP